MTSPSLPRRPSLVAAFGLTTLALLALPPISGASADAPADPVTQVTFVVNDANCAGGSAIDFYVGATLVATRVSPIGCQCGDHEFIFSVDDPALLGGIQACPNVRAVRQNSNDAIAYIRADITRASGTESICVADFLGGSPTGGGTCAKRDLCQGYSGFGSGGTDPGAASYDEFVGGPPDIDGDGLNSCVDPDLDNDGAANAQDNCPTTVNPLQQDSDGNGTGDACQAAVAAVPWAGLESKAHVVYSGGSIVLQASASLGGSGEPVSLASGTWDPGDGSGPQAINVSDSRALELPHTYVGADGQPFTATIRIVDPSGAAYTDTFKVQIQPRSLDVETNMAIDRALWHQHKLMALSGTGPSAEGSWIDNGEHAIAAATASTAQAFQVNGHRQDGDPLKDPYADDVARSLRYLQTHIQRFTISATDGMNPDGNGNGYGLQPDRGEVVYIVGQIIDAFVASGRPTAVATVGSEAGRTYHDIVQDLVDAYAWGQNEDGQGGWVYGWNEYGIDSSSSGWWGVGAHAAVVWNITQPAFVTERNLTLGIPALQAFNGSDTGQDGSCGYRSAGGNIAETSACLIMMSADGVGRDNARYQAAERFVRRNFFVSNDSQWTGRTDPHGSMYAMYNLTKAMRLAPGGPITLLGGDLDWYAGPQGLAPHLIATQQENGEWTNYSWANGSLSTAWGILILSPALFEQGPTAVCAIDATIVCRAGASGGCNTTGLDPYATVNLDGSQSTAGDNAIASYSWNFQDNSPLVTTIATTHSFSTVGTYAIQLTVRDTKGISSSVTCPVQVTESALPPISNPGGPYSICEGKGAVVLDGSGSTGRGANIVSYQWDFTPAINFAAVDAITVTTDQTAYFNAQAAGTYDVALRVRDDSSSHFETTSYTTVTIKPSTALECLVDTDHDGIPDGDDACPGYDDHDDVDHDGLPDSCDDCPLDAQNDADHDGICGQFDFCPNDADNDADGDFICGNIDACPHDGQNNIDGDAFCGDVDPCPLDAQNDADGDGLCADVDACPNGDSTSPSIVCPADASVECNANHSATGVTIAAATATDLCGGVTVSGGVAPGWIFPLGTSAVSQEASDTSNNHAVCTSNVTVVDTTAPALSCPANVVVECSAAGSATGVSAGIATARDVCTSTTVTDPAVAAYPLGTTTATHGAVDERGNRNTCTNTVTVRDTIGPAFNAGSLGARTVLGTCASAPVSFTLPTARDICQAATVSCAALPGNSIGANNVTCTATDAGGNVTTTTLVVNVLAPLRLMFQPPLEDDNVANDPDTDADVANVFKVGSTVPHKIKLVACNGTDVTGAFASQVTLRLTETYRSGVGSASTAIVPEYNGQGDAGGVLNYDGSQFHYNLSTNAARYPAGTAANAAYFSSLITATYNAAPSIIAGREDARLESK